MEIRNLDSTFFNAWLNAYAFGDSRVMAISERCMPQYKQPAKARAVALEAQATVAFNEGSEAGSTADKYVRTTVLLATVLVLVGLSTHFPPLSVRYGLVGLGAVLLVASAGQLLALPGPPA